MDRIQIVDEYMHIEIAFGFNFYEFYFAARAVVFMPLTVFLSQGEMVY